MSSPSSARRPSGTSARCWKPWATCCCSIAKSLASIPHALRSYRKEIAKTLAEVVFGVGALSVIAGTVGVIAFLAFFAGTEVGLQGYASLSQIGVAKFTAFISAYFNTREVAPLVSGIALAATVGCGYTARLGSMRISEEIDALEVMGVPSLPFLVTTRMIAGFIAVIPLYTVALLASYLSPRLITVMIYGESAGTYDHYFRQFLPPIDILWSFAKLIILAVLIILIHCYYGYTATGGPAGVGLAVGAVDPRVDRDGRRRQLLPQLRHLGIDDHRADHGVGLMYANIIHDSPAEHRRLWFAGIANLVVISLMIWFCIALYNKKFTNSTDVTVMADRAGLQLARFGDVRLHGALVGHVKKIESDGKQAKITLALDPDSARSIPATPACRSCPRRCSAATTSSWCRPRTGPRQGPCGTARSSRPSA